MSSPPAQFASFRQLANLLVTHAKEVVIFIWLESPILNISKS